MAGKVFSRLEETAAVIRWIHVAYYNRFDFALFTEDVAFVSVDRLLSLCNNLLGSAADGGSTFVYAGFVNSFTLAPDTYGHKYYAPFAEAGTILMSRAVTELIAREIGLVQPLPRFDATIANFLAAFINGAPQHIDGFVPNIANTYDDIASPIIVLGADPDVMKALSEGRPLIGANKEMETRGIYVNPYPKDEDPACNDGKGGCDVSKLRLQSALP